MGGLEGEDILRAGGGGVDGGGVFGGGQKLLRAAVGSPEDAPTALGDGTAILPGKLDGASDVFGSEAGDIVGIGNDVRAHTQGHVLGGDLHGVAAAGGQAGEGGGGLRDFQKLLKAFAAAADEP